MKNQVLKRINELGLECEIKNFDLWFTELNEKQINNFLSIPLEIINFINYEQFRNVFNTEMKIWNSMPDFYYPKNIIINPIFLNHDNIIEILNKIIFANSIKKSLYMCQIVTTSDLSKSASLNEYLDIVNFNNSPVFDVILTKILTQKKFYDISDDDIKKVLTIINNCKGDYSDIYLANLKLEAIYDLIVYKKIGDNYDLYHKESIDAICKSSQPYIILDICHEPESRESQFHLLNIYCASHTQRGEIAMAINELASYSKINKHYLMDLICIYLSSPEIAGCLMRLARNELSANSDIHVNELFQVMNASTLEDAVTITEQILSKYKPLEKKL